MFGQYFASNIFPCIQYYTSPMSISISPVLFSIPFNKQLKDMNHLISFQHVSCQFFLESLTSGLEFIGKRVNIQYTILLKYPPPPNNINSLKYVITTHSISLRNSDFSSAAVFAAERLHLVDNITFLGGSLPFIVLGENICRRESVTKSFTLVT